MRRRHPVDKAKGFHGRLMGCVILQICPILDVVVAEFSLGAPALSEVCCDRQSHHNITTSHIITPLHTSTRNIT